MEVQFDTKAFDRAARNWGAAIDQVPFAVANALNESAEQARAFLIESTWPSSVTVRDPNFLKNALTLKGGRATKRDLTVTLAEKGRAAGRANLPLHARGGTRKPGGSHLAIPSSNIAGRRGAKGLPKSLRPRTAKGTFRKDNMIFRRVGDGVQLMFSLRPQARIKKDVPFFEDFRAVMVREMGERFYPAIMRAMQTRKVR